jgi:hypothetical protein
MFDSRKERAIRWGYDNGWAFIRLRGKVPRDVGWQRSERLPLDEILNHDGNIGLRTGSGLVVVDIDEGADLTGLDLPETVEVRTGSGGRHLYYSYDKPLRNSAGKLGRHIDIRGDGGQVVYPGSIHPTTKRPYEFVRPPWEYPLAPLPEWIVDRLTAPKVPASLPAGAAAPAASNGRTSAYVRAAVKLILAELRQAPEGTRNDALNKAAFALGQFIPGGHIKRGDAESELHAAAAALGLPFNESDATIKSGLDAGEKEPRKIPAKAAPVAAPMTDTRKPEVPVPGAHPTGERTIEQSTTAFAGAVLDHLPEGIIYTRSGLPGEVTGQAGRQRWFELSENRMRLIVDRHVKLVQWSKKKDADEYFPAYRPCSRDYAGLVIAAAATSTKARPLNLMTSYPTYQPDWSLTPAGWHNGVFYDVPPDLEGLAPITDFEEIRDTLDELVTDFPFADVASRQNYFGLLLTPIITPAIEGNRPLHLISASIERSGKSKLAEDVLGGIFLGEPTPAIQITGTDDERDKRILSLLLQGGTLVHLDNLPRKLDSAALASLLTSRVYQGRVLGATRILSLPNNLTAVATGNNTICSSEMAKRIIPIRLQPLTSRPEDRTVFQHPDLPRFIRDNRRRLLACLLGMVENWKARGCPPHPLPLGGFERWSRTVGGILHANLFQDWRKNEKEWRRQSDVEGEQRLALVEAWWKLFRDSTVTPTEVLRFAENVEGFDWVFSANSERARVTRMGKWLRQHIDTPIGGWSIRRQVSRDGNVYYLTQNKAYQI